MDEEKKQKIEEGQEDEDVYTEEGEELLTENDEITDIEEGIMLGYEEGENLINCVQCKKELIDDKFIEEEIENELYRFCSEQCAERFAKKKTSR